MSRPDFVTDPGIARRFAEGRGTGDGPDYKTWHRVPEFSSRGFRTMLFSPRLGRVIHLFSLLELFVFLYAEWHSNYVEIKENYPLPRPRTRQIVELHLPAGIRHPQVDGTDIVIATDLLITEELTPGVFTRLAWSTKYEDELRNPRPVEKQQIEQLFYEGSDSTLPAKFTLMTEKKLPMPMVDNIRYVRGTTRPGAMLG